jgi:hypothetical protein
VVLGDRLVWAGEHHALAAQLAHRQCIIKNIAQSIITHS